jgi:hypothetical protein
VGDPADAETGSADTAEKPRKPKEPESEVPDNTPLWKKSIVLAYYVAGLQGTYLAWGVLQEQMMTQSYGTDEDGNPIRFKNSQYLVFLNRGLALMISYVWILVTVQPRHRAPLYKYSFPSMANVMSSWCQYEALKYVSFPTQVLAKSTKIIPVMIMGKFVQSKTYPVYEYVCAILLSIGVALFFFSRAEEEGNLSQEDDVPSGLVLVFGAFLLIGYMVFDRCGAGSCGVLLLIAPFCFPSTHTRTHPLACSFTSNYQSAMFKSYKVSSYQMMNGVNIFSCIFTLWTLIQVRRTAACGCVCVCVCVCVHVCVPILTGASQSIPFACAARHADGMRGVYVQVPDVYVAQLLALHLLCGGPALHLPDNREVRRPGLYHHHDHAPDPLHRPLRHYLWPRVFLGGKRPCWGSLSPHSHPHSITQRQTSE